MIADAHLSRGRQQPRHPATDIHCDFCCLILITGSLHISDHLCNQDGRRLTRQCTKKRIWLVSWLCTVNFAMATEIAVVLDLQLEHREYNILHLQNSLHDIRQARIQYGPCDICGGVFQSGLEAQQLQQEAAAVIEAAQQLTDCSVPNWSSSSS